MASPDASITLDVDGLRFDAGSGLVTVVTQDADTGAVLMVAHADREALERTIASGEMHYRSRTRGLWHKGATSGNMQRVVSLAADCDADVVLALVHPAGPACHTGERTCFGDHVQREAHRNAFEKLDATISERAGDADATASYTRRLLADRNLRLKKIGEEAAELAVACADGDAARAAAEAADLWYHTLVALRALGVGLAEVEAVLAERDAQASQ